MFAVSGADAECRCGMLQDPGCRCTLDIEIEGDVRARVC
jgi:hypothetical protein